MGSFAIPVHGGPMGGVNINPTGSNGTGGVTHPWGSTTFMPPTGSPGNYGYGTSANPTPTMFPGGLPAPPVTGGVGAGSATNSQLNNPLGSGLGPQVQTFLNSNGGYNSFLTQQNVEAQIAEMNRQAMTGYGNLVTAEGGAGINPNSSTAALAASNYESNVTAAENAITAQEYFNMWQSSMGNEVSVLEAAISPSAQRQQQQYSSPFDWASLGVDWLTGGASAALSAIG